MLLTRMDKLALASERLATSTDMLLLSMERLVTSMDKLALALERLATPLFGMPHAPTPLVSHLMVALGMAN